MTEPALPDWSPETVQAKQPKLSENLKIRGVELYPHCNQVIKVYQETETGKQYVRALEILEVEPELLADMPYFTDSVELEKFAQKLGLSLEQMTNKAHIEKANDGQYGDDSYTLSVDTDNLGYILGKRTYDLFKAIKGKNFADVLEVIRYQTLVNSYADFLSKRAGEALKASTPSLAPTGGLPRIEFVDRPVAGQHNSQVAMTFSGEIIQHTLAFGFAEPRDKLDIRAQANVFIAEENQVNFEATLYHERGHEGFEDHVGKALYDASHSGTFNMTLAFHEGVATVIELRALNYEIKKAEESGDAQRLKDLKKERSRTLKSRRGDLERSRFAERLYYAKLEGNPHKLSLLEKQLTANNREYSLRVESGNLSSLLLIATERKKFDPKDKRLPELETKITEIRRALKDPDQLYHIDPAVVDLATLIQSGEHYGAGVWDILHRFERKGYKLIDGTNPLIVHFNYAYLATIEIGSPEYWEILAAYRKMPRKEEHLI